MTSVLLLTDRPAFESLWSAACVRVGLPAQLQAPAGFADGLARGAALVFDGEAAEFAGDALLAHVGLARAHGALTAVALPEDGRFAARDQLLLELCGGLVARCEADVGRVAIGLQHRSRPARETRFEFLGPAPGSRALLAILGDGTVTTIDAPDAREQPDAASVSSIRVADDRRTAQVSWGNGATLDLIAAELAHTQRMGPPRGANGTPPAGLGDVDGVRLGQRLRALRIAAGLTQAELARRTGIHRPNIARVEAGRHTPSLETLARLAAAIGVSTTRVLAD